MDLLDEFVKQGLHKYLTNELELGQYTMELDDFEATLYFTESLHYVTIHVDLWCGFELKRYEKTFNLESLPCSTYYKI